MISSGSDGFDDFVDISEDIIAPLNKDVDDSFKENGIMVEYRQSEKKLTLKE